MRIITPRATPVVRAPSTSVPPSERERERPPLLRAPVTIITPQGDLDLLEGALLVGRLPECDIVIEDGLVSRMHARLSVRDDSVLVEDLHSTNGVYVNGVRITHSALLREGDRLLTGTTELSLFEARCPTRLDPQARVATARPGPRGAEPARHSATAPTTPPAAARRPAASTLPVDQRSGGFGRPQFNLPEPQEPEPQERDGNSSETRLSTPAASRPSDLKALRARTSAVPSTARADALEVIGALADRLAASGNLDEARRVLSSHLKRILQGATAGLTVPEDVCALAARHALSLARWNGQATWIDYVVELHLAGQRAMTPLTYTAFESIALSLGGFDRQLLIYYVDSLRERREPLAGDEQLVLERLILLCEV